MGGVANDPRIQTHTCAVAAKITKQVINNSHRCLAPAMDCNAVAMSTTNAAWMPLENELRNQNLSTVAFVTVSHTAANIKTQNANGMCPVDALERERSEVAPRPNESTGKEVKGD